MARTRRRSASRRPDAISPAPFVGMSLLAATGFLYLWSPVLVPWWVFVPLLACWIGALVLSVRWWTPQPHRLPWVAAGAVVLWAVVVLGGTLTFSW